MASNEYTPVAPKNGGETHATSLREPGFTVCGIKFRGWVICPHKLSCQKCKDGLKHRPPVRK